MKTLKKFDFASRGEATYDWAKMLDGGTYHLVEGEDFKCKPATFQTMCRNQAGKQHKTVQIGKHEDGGLVVKATPMTKEQADAYDAKVAERKAAKEADAGDEAPAE